MPAALRDMRQKCFVVSRHPGGRLGFGSPEIFDRDQDGRGDRDQPAEAGEQAVLDHVEVCIQVGTNLNMIGFQRGLELLEVLLGGDVVVDGVIDLGRDALGRRALHPA